MDDVDGMILPAEEPQGEWAPSGWAPQFAWETAAPPPPEPKRRGLVALWAGMLALVGSVAFAFFFLAGNGAETPEQAVERLFEAVSNEDVLGVLEALPPSERDAAKDHVTDIVAELKRLEVLSADADPSKISGLDLALQDVELSATSLGDGVSTVTVRGGTGSYSVTPDQLPLGPLVRDLLGDSLPSQTISDSTPLVSDDPLELVAIKEDGRWYVSVWYSVAEAIRKETGAPAPDFGQGVQARGEASPEAALRAMIEAGLRLDARRAVELLPPDEARALHDYAPLFLPTVERLAADAREEFSLQLDELETSVERDGDEARVGIKAITVSGVVDGEQGSFRYDGSCFEFTVDGEQERVCPEQIGAMTGLTPRALGWGDSAVVAVERDGEWFLSPTRSLLDGMVRSLRLIERSDLDALSKGFGGWFGFGLRDTFELGGGDQAVELDPDFFGRPREAVDGVPVPPAAEDADEEILVEPEAALGGYSFEQFLQLPPEEQARILAELQEKAGRP